MHHFVYMMHLSEKGNSGERLISARLSYPPELAQKKLQKSSNPTERSCTKSAQVRVT